MEVIEKVTEPKDWVNSLVIVEKPNRKLILCLDPKDLNEAINSFATKRDSSRAGRLYLSLPSATIVALLFYI